MNKYMSANSTTQMKHILRKTQILKCTQKEIENLERPLQNKDIKLIKDFPQRKPPNRQIH